MAKRKRTKFTWGCPVCGSKNIKKVSGFTLCGACGHKLGDGGLGRQTERRDFNGDWQNVARYTSDGTAKLPGADEQVKTPQPRGRPYRTELK